MRTIARASGAGTFVQPAHATAGIAEFDRADRGEAESIRACRSSGMPSANNSAARITPPWLTIDWYSRYVLAWRLSNTMDTSFCLDAR
jgi:transposase InsO family protein